MNRRNFLRTLLGSAMVPFLGWNPWRQRRRVDWSIPPRVRSVSDAVMLIDPADVPLLTRFGKE